MNPTVIDGNLLKLLITNGTIALRNDHQRINDLNVFPVPDGDTGSNMQSTMMSGVKAISTLNNESVEKIAKSLSRGLLMGARGNSGVILSQLFSGFAKVFKGKETVSTIEFIEGMVQGVKQAYSAVINPVEGTILTVAREAADKALAAANDDSGLYDVMQVYIREAYESLERTPDLLAVLKEAGVIDSGGAGFNVIIDGMIMAMEGNVLEDKGTTATQSLGSKIAEYQEESIDFGYCTEFIIELKDGPKFSKDRFTKRIARFGDSLAVVADDEICKVHIHTKTPGDVLNFGQQYGEFLTLKIENMTQQHSEIIEHAHQHEEPENNNITFYPAPSKKFGIITVVNGPGLKETFKEMGVSAIIDGGQTMNPSTEDFITAVEKMDTEHVIIIPNNGNVLLSAQHAAKYIEDRSVSVVHAKTIAQGYASLTMFDANQTLEENMAEMEDLVAHVKSGEVTYAVRDTEYKGVKIKKGEFIGIAEGEIITSKVDRKDTVCDLCKELLDDESEIITVMYGKDVQEDEVETIALCIETHYPDVEVEFIEGHQDIYSYIIAVE